MKNLTLHSNGPESHIKALRQKLKEDVFAVKNNHELSALEKSKAIKDLEAKFSQDAKTAKKSLY